MRLGTYRPLPWENIVVTLPVALLRYHRSPRPGYPHVRVKVRGSHQKRQAALQLNRESVVIRFDGYPSDEVADAFGRFFVSFGQAFTEHTLKIRDVLFVMLQSRGVEANC